MRKVPWAFCEWWKLGGGGERLCRDWWTSQKSCNVTGRPLRNTRFVIGSMREEPASNRRGLAVLLCVRTCGCLLKEKDYVSASVIGPAARGKPQSEDNHMSVNRGDPMVIFHFHKFWVFDSESRKKGSKCSSGDGHASFLCPVCFMNQSLSCTKLEPQPEYSALHSPLIQCDSLHNSH